jgi:hypothetical protein
VFRTAKLSSSIQLGGRYFCRQAAGENGREKTGGKTVEKTVERTVEKTVEKKLVELGGKLVELKLRRT